MLSEDKGLLGALETIIISHRYQLHAAWTVIPQGNCVLYRNLKDEDQMICANRRMPRDLVKPKSKAISGPNSFCFRILQVIYIIAFYK